MLKPGDKFPKIKLPLVGGGALTLPEDVIDSWTYIMFYRGGW